MADIKDRCGLGAVGLLERLNADAQKAGQIVIINKIPKDEFICDVEDYNNEIIMAQVIPSAAFNPVNSAYTWYHWRSKLTETEGHHNCFIRYEAKNFIKGAVDTETTYNYFLLSDAIGAYTWDNPTLVRYTQNLIVDGAMYGGNLPFQLSAYQGGHITDNDIQNNLATWLSAYDADNIRAKYKAISDEIIGLYLTTPIQPLNNYMGFYSVIPTTTSIYATQWSYEKLAFPVFDINDTNEIIKFLRTGDTSGSIDPFDTNPAKTEVTDFRTMYKVFVTPDEGDPNGTHFSIIAYNNDYIEGGEALAGKYGMKVSYDYMKTQTSTPMTYKAGTFIQSKYPTCGIMFSDVGYDTLFHLIFNETTEPYTPVTATNIGFEKDISKECNCNVVGANYGGTVLNKIGIKDGYKFVIPTTGVTIVEVYFRAADIDDLKDGGYTEDDDNEDDATGDDVSLISGSGYGTFMITDNQFAEINKKLWSTDWTQVFKSNSVNPIQCVIACKSLPFSATGASYGTIKIANLDTGVEANKINPVKSFTVGSVSIPPYRGDFTDIEGVRVHLYLPFIGWVELPASEVVGRRGFDGVAPKAKTLSFKYIVDFIDGHVRCVISVSGTERWYFDGNCAIDIPVTSDNHTAAMSTAIKSGVASVMSVASAIAGAYTGNGFMVASGVAGAVENMANTIPTYNYSASASPAGYINASMNNHIMIVIERPNIVETEDYAHVVGRPCGLYLSLAGLSGFTKCANVDVSGIPCTPEEQAMIKSALENGVYL